MNNDELSEETIEHFRERFRQQYKCLYYDRQGKEIPVMEWSEKFEDEKYKILIQEDIGFYFISTVWIGMNMNAFRQGPIAIFETMIFLKDEYKQKIEDELEYYQERYATEKEAFEGHERAVSIAKGAMLIRRIAEFQQEEIEKGLPQASQDLLT